MQKTSLFSVQNNVAPYLFMTQQAIALCRSTPGKNGTEAPTLHSIKSVQPSNKKIFQWFVTFKIKLLIQPSCCKPVLQSSGTCCDIRWRDSGHHHLPMMLHMVAGVERCSKASGFLFQLQSRPGVLEWTSSSKMPMPESSWRVLSSYCPEKRQKVPSPLMKFCGSGGGCVFSETWRKPFISFLWCHWLLKITPTFIINLRNDSSSCIILKTISEAFTRLEDHWPNWTEASEKKHVLRDWSWHIQEIQSLASP